MGRGSARRGGRWSGPRRSTGCDGFGPEKSVSRALVFVHSPFVANDLAVADRAGRVSGATPVIGLERLPQPVTRGGHHRPAGVLETA
jgi:hypothetical protein